LYEWRGSKVFCRACGKQIEADSRFCRFCGKSQAEGPAAAPGGPGAKVATSSGSGLERRLRQVFPRHHLQDEITHFLTMAAIVIGVVGFVLALFPPLGAGLYALAWLLFAILLLLFVMHRDATLAHTRTDRAEDASTARHHAGRGAVPDRGEAPQIKK
jgi:hypothetical protein